MPVVGLFSLASGALLDFAKSSIHAHESILFGQLMAILCPPRFPDFLSSSSHLNLCYQCNQWLRFLFRNQISLVSVPCHFPFAFILALFFACRLGAGKLAFVATNDRRYGTNCGSAKLSAA